ncbi:hypothetical protein KFE25_013603 [Diacronema lutheri]|uniref:Nucleotide-diphospho-sugar transferase domain-containing protein n=2 Tax=Diacronema lutheri TaxID=2081491 RepID=A0A8J5XZN7_DIALT|nr:hypothetical protein KFE25_013603 [Diacronema lutheri]
MRALVVLIGAAAIASTHGRPRFSGGDLENATVWRSLVAWAVERQVVLVTTNEHGLVDAVGTLLQLRSHGVMPTLVHATSKAVCDALYEAVPDGACAWTTWKPPTIVGEWKPPNFRTVLFVARKYIVHRLAVDEGIAVLQTDTDTVWFVNPFALFDSPALREYDVIVQRDAPFANAGVMFVRNARAGTGAAYVVAELLRTLQRFSGEDADVLRAVREVLPAAAAVARKVDNEQMHLNDIIASAALGRRVWSSSIKRLYGADGSVCAHPNCDEPSRRAYAETSAAVHALLANTGPLDLCVPSERSPSLCGLAQWRRAALRDSGLAVSVSDLTARRGLMSHARASKLLIAPPLLFAHLLSFRTMVAEQRSARCRQTESLRARLGARLGAANGSDAWAWEEHRAAPVVAMVHLAALSSAKHQRAVVVQGLGSWDARADGAGARFGRPRLYGATMRVITLANFDMSALVNASRGDGAEQALIRPLLRLAQLTGRRPALPGFPCGAGASATSVDARAKARVNQVELIVPNSDCGQPVPADASRTPATGGECMFVSTSQCHSLVLSQFELRRLRANASGSAEGESAHARAPDAGGSAWSAERRVRLDALVRGAHGAHGDATGAHARDLDVRARELLGADLDVTIVTIDGGGAPLAALDGALAALPQFAEPSAHNTLAGEHQRPVEALCRVVMSGLARSAHAAHRKRKSGATLST